MQCPPAPRMRTRSLPVVPNLVPKRVGEWLRLGLDAGLSGHCADAASYYYWEQPQGRSTLKPPAARLAVAVAVADASLRGVLQSSSASADARLTPSPDGSAPTGAIDEGLYGPKALPSLGNELTAGFRSVWACRSLGPRRRRSPASLRPLVDPVLFEDHMNTVSSRIVPNE